MLVAAVIVVAIVVVSNNKDGRNAPGGSGAAASSSTPRNMASYGVLLTGSKGNITTVRTPAVEVGHPVPTDTSTAAAAP